LDAVFVPDVEHYTLVARAALDGEVIPFLGAGANLLDVPADSTGAARQRLPSGAELTALLADKILYPDPHPDDLLRVAQYVDALLGEGKLYKVLHEVFDHASSPNALHDLLATMPPLLRAHGAPQQLIMTTNYDDTLERAFELHGEEYDVVWYEAKPRDQSCGKFLHRAPGREPATITLPNDYRELSFGARPVILKLHGAVQRGMPALDSYVITENNYIDYLTQSDISREIPVVLREAMESSHFLFLGYSMRDWNLRVILKRIWGRRPLAFQSWAIQKPLEDERQNRIEQRLWSERRDEIELYQVALDEYVAGLEEHIQLAASLDARPR
jgi:SIR2-like domain